MGEEAPVRFLKSSPCGKIESIVTNHVSLSMKRENELQDAKQITPSFHLLPTTLNDIGQILQENQLSMQELSFIWDLILPLFHADQEPKSRDAVREDGHLGKSILSFLHVCLQTQNESCRPLKQTFFKTIQTLDLSQDVLLCLQVVKELTHDGREMKELESELSSLLIYWIEHILASVPKRQTMDGSESDLFIQQCLPLFAFVTNVVKFNFVNLTELSCLEMLRSTTDVCLALEMPEHGQIANSCLMFFDAFIRYGSLPSSSVQAVIQSLCRLCLFEECESLCWQSILHLISSHRMFTTMKLLCLVLEADGRQNNQIDQVCAGAIHFLSSLKWGPKRMENLTYPSTLVLYCFLNHTPRIGKLSLKKLLAFLDSLSVHTTTTVSIIEWELVLDLAEKLYQDIFSSARNSSLEKDDRAMFLSCIVCLKSRFQSMGRMDAFYTIVNDEMSENSLEFMSEWLDQFFESIWQYSFEEWVHELEQFVNRGFHAADEMGQIKQKLTSRLSHVFSIISPSERQTLVSKILLPLFSISLSLEDAALLETVCRLMILVIPEYSEHQLLLFVDHVVQELTAIPAMASPSQHWTLMTDLLIRIMISCSFVQASLDQVFDKVMDLVKNTHLHSSIRFRLVSYLCSMRADEHYRVDLSLTGLLKTPFLFPVELPVLVLIRGSAIDIPDEKSKKTSLNIEKYVDCLIHLLAHESDWSVFWFVIKHIPYQLENMFIFSTCSSQMQRLRAWCCDTVTSETAGNTISEIPSSIKKTEIYDAVYRLSMILLQYRSFFTKAQQDDLILSFLVGFQKWPRVSTAKLCLQALTLALFEMPESVSRLLPSILMKVSQTTTHAMGVWNVEFLSTLGRLPSLFKNFTEADFKRVFGVALQYIQYTDVSGMTSHSTTVSESDPFHKGHAAVSQYVVNMAYYVLGIWFKNVKLSERRKYVPFIIQFLLQNRPISQSNPDEDVEMVLDILAVNCFADCLPKPTTEETVERDKLPMKTWLFGNSLISIRSLPYLSHEKQGWVETIIKRPSGVIQFKSRLENRLRFNSDLDDGQGVTLSAETSLHMVDEALPMFSAGQGPVLDRNSQFGRRASLSSIHNSRESGDVTPTHSEKGSPRRPRAASFGVGFLQDQMEQWTSLQKMKSSSSLSSSSPSRALSHEKIPEVLEQGKTQTLETPNLARVSSRLFQNTSLTLAMEPSFPFLQMLHFPDWSGHVTPPTMLPDDDATRRAVKVLDHIPVVDLHKIGVVFVGKKQTEQNDILSNTHGSPSYHTFLQNVGELVRLKDCKDVYTGGLDTSHDVDGKVALWWGDHDSSQMIFHVTTLMPNRPEHDLERTGKKRHIGNNYVLVVWNESGLDRDSGSGGYKFDTIPAQFNFINIIITPLGQVSTTAKNTSESFVQSIDAPWIISTAEYYKVYVQRRPDIPDTIGGGTYSSGGLNVEDRPRILSASALPSFIRQLCIHANIFAQVFQAAQSNTGFSSNTKERLRQLKRIRDRIQAHVSVDATATSSIDFTTYL